jgi:hypothetical protein
MKAEKWTPKMGRDAIVPNFDLYHFLGCCTGDICGSARRDAVKLLGVGEMDLPGQKDYSKTVPPKSCQISLVTAASNNLKSTYKFQNGVSDDVSSVPVKIPDFLGKLAFTVPLRRRRPVCSSPTHSFACHRIAPSTLLRQNQKSQHK